MQKNQVFVYKIRMKKITAVNGCLKSFKQKQEKVFSYTIRRKFYFFLPFKICTRTLTELEFDGAQV